MFADLREAGETCGKHRVERTMRNHKIQAIRGYTSPKAVKGRLSILVPNRVNREWPAIAKELVLVALMMAVWRRKPTQEVIVRSGQGSQYSSADWRRFCDANQLLPSMRRRGNC